MPASAFTVTNAIKERMGNKEIDFDLDTFKVVLLSSSSNIAATSDDATAVTGELSTANGYTAGGVTCNSAWTRSGGTCTFDLTTDPSWTANSGTITARFAAVIDTTPTPDRVVAFCTLDNTPADVTTTSGNTLTLQISSNGVFTLA